MANASRKAAFDLVTTDKIRALFPQFTEALTRRREAIAQLERLARANLDEQVMGSPGDEADASVIDASADYFLRMANSHHQELNEIEDALNRIHRGSYGMCESCEEPISTERLKKKPEARFCVDCQAQSERLASVTYPFSKLT